MKKVSFVVPTFRRPDALANTLAALAAVDPCGLAVEIVVADDDPAASAREVAHAFGAGHVTSGGWGAAAARNAGAAAARGELLVFCDDDMLVEPSHLREQLATREALGDCAVNGEWTFSDAVRAQLSREPFGRYRLRLEERFRLHHHAGEQVAPGCLRAATVTAANLALRRELFEALGGFDTAFPHAGTEDQDLSLRLAAEGVLLVRNLAIRLRHADRHVSLEDYCAREERGALSFVTLAAKHPQVFRDSAYVRENGPLSRADPPLLVAEKGAKRLLSTGPGLRTLHAAVHGLERAHAPQPLLDRAYATLIGLHSFRGVRGHAGGLAPEPAVPGRAPATVRHRVATTVRRPAAATVSLAMRSRAGRRAVNARYERGGRPAAVLAWLCDAIEVPAPFTWNVHIARTSFELPVAPEPRRSLSDAMYWRWPPAAGMRAFYEWYLDHGPAAGVMLDVGANDGMHSYPFAARGWHCVCFEPQATCVDYIERVRARNHMRIDVVQAVVAGREDGAVPFFVSTSTWYSSTRRDAVERFEPSQRVHVACVTLDAYCAAHGLTPQLVKIDVEGGEEDVLRGAADTIVRHRPVVVIEVESEPGVRAAVWHALGYLGYRAYAIEDRPRPLADLDAFTAAAAGAPHGDFAFVCDSDLQALLG